MSSHVGVEANSMTGVLVRKGRLGLGHRQERKHHEAVEAVIKVKHPRMFQSKPHQGSLVASRDQGRGLAQIPSGPPRRNQHSCHLSSRLLGPRTMRQYVSFGFSHPVCGHLLWQLEETDMPDKLEL